MQIAFILTMPQKGSWNGKWTGENNLYAKIRKVKETDNIAEILKTKDFYYSWSDGWGANVEVRKVTTAEANRLMKSSRGFYGYEWMIDSILTHKEILNSSGLNNG